jgi:site-specific DNA-methyltransferase (adenine-specific)
MMVLKNSVYNNDCFELFDIFDNESIDCIITDPPYNITDHAWEKQINIKLLFSEYIRILKNNAVFIVFGAEPFSSHCRLAGLPYYKFDFVWDKIIPSGMSYAKFQPMRQHENIMVFCKGKLPYNPQMIKRDKPIKSGGQKNLHKGANNLNKYKKENFSKTYDYKNPTSILTCMKVRKNTLHPTQKPVELIEYLIKTFSNTDDVILDTFAGSGTTGIAAKNTNRNYILVEKNEEYYKIIAKRLG